MNSMNFTIRLANFLNWKITCYLIEFFFLTLFHVIKIEYRNSRKLMYEVKSKIDFQFISIFDIRARSSLDKTCQIIRNNE